MEEMTIRLKGLTCANCAGKIEDAVEKMEETREVHLNLMKQELRLTLAEGAARESVFEKVRDTVKKYESHVEVSLAEPGSHSHDHEEHCHEGCCGHTHGQEEDHTHSHEEGFGKKQLLRFSLGLALFLAAVLWQGEGETLLFLGAYVVFGYDVLWRALRNISKGQIFDENFLMSLSTIGALVIGEMAEAVFVMLFYQIGEAFQAYAVARSRKSITALLDIRPDTVWLLTEEGPRQVSPEQVAVGDRILVKAGERIPLDGIIKKGSAMADTSALTGESVPRFLREGDMALSGCIDQDGLLEIEVTKEFGESMVMKILEMVENAAARKSRTERFITRFARVYTPVVVALAVVLAVLPPVLGMGEFSMWLGRALIFLVVSCPCALVLSVPLTYFAGIGAASRNGILVKGGGDLDTLCHVERVVFDKTGTLTEGKFSVTEIRAEKAEELLALAAAAEGSSNHPIARAVVEKYHQAGTVPQPALSDIKERGGFGITCRAEGEEVLLGNRRLLAEAGIDCPVYEGAGSVIYAAKGGKYLGCLVVADQIRPGCVEGLKSLRQAGIREMVMLTGDRRETAEAVGKELGMDHVRAELLPQDKLASMEGFLELEGTAKTAFVGDGINDAPVLAGADVGIAMGAIGSDAAIEAADVVLMEDEIGKLAVALRIARNTRRIVLQNIVFALAVKAAVLLLSAVGLATMWMAVFADVGVALIAIWNAMRKK
ncbi:cadmium-translocating P-type ATPase [Anaerotignum lactatifermentans]|uniref:Cd(2+)-exporting ATPase n=1 Tax=Anaerotignum lactatifermentans TaxID=160404 RepID=A0ABS2GBJ0_9FIRM|nr:heavy metal translocating P-type ATPase [Anaerotignum lactatifermentans]MBM6828603.1 cadmium-translocating P-type ATPase [Anaerotignum lactatifermentans]MBM6878525.1 cadmium-translocating P-type ATPase [Anaerotignum lactatifermentans]MBM6950185.1 cadmium-translocating P-type ATPase [Anaerotignum lactatifermentans]